MKTRLPIERIDLGGGDYVELYRDLLVRTQREIQQFSLSCVEPGVMPTPEALGPHEDKLVELFFVNQVVRLHIQVLRCYRVFGRTVYRRLKALDFEPPFNYEAILKALDEIGFEKLQLLKGAMSRLYGQDPLTQASDGN